MIAGSMHYQVDQHSAFHPMVEEPLPAVPMMHAPIQPVQVQMQPVQATAAAGVRMVQMQPVQPTAALATYKGEVTDCYCCSNKSSRATFFKDSIVLDDTDTCCCYPAASHKVYIPKTRLRAIDVMNAVYDPKVWVYAGVFTVILSVASLILYANFWPSPAAQALAFFVLLGGIYCFFHPCVAQCCCPKKHVLHFATDDHPGTFECCTFIPGLIKGKFGYDSKYTIALDQMPDETFLNEYVGRPQEPAV